MYEHTKEVSLRMYRCTYTKKVIRLGYVYEHVKEVSLKMYRCTKV